MSNIYSLLTNLSHAQLMGLFVLAFIIHELEEWNITAFELRNFEGLPPTVTARNARLWIAIVCTIAIVWYGAAMLSGNATLAAYIFVPAVLLALGNALQHIFWTGYFRQYAPGLATAVLLVIPASLAVIYRALAHWQLSPWYAGAWLALIGFVLLQTVREGRRASPMIGAIYGLGDRLSQALQR